MTKDIDRYFSIKLFTTQTLQHSFSYCVSTLLVDIFSHVSNKVGQNGVQIYSNPLFDRLLALLYYVLLYSKMEQQTLCGEPFFIVQTIPKLCYV